VQGIRGLGREGGAGGLLKAGATGATKLLGRENNRTTETIKLHLDVRETGVE